ncbi:glycoside hydrolase family 16 protein [Candidatus Entotheonella palauensis]|uniref:glycoside hydrolase family 16 protein n=1 Tax=Candidatus Entotheonella palauensis TaxID=93172 RepID=UPI0021190FEF|nr:hypothetical protein [Candidatus Entotheonella palauensis]
MLKLSGMLLLIVLLTSSLVSAQWTQIWSDEFNYSGLPDADKWGYERGYIRNDERQYYTVQREKNARVENGHLILEAHREDYEGMHCSSMPCVALRSLPILPGQANCASMVISPMAHMDGIVCNYAQAMPQRLGQFATAPIMRISCLAA